MKMLDKLLQIVLIAGIITAGFVFLMAGITISIVYYKWWSILIVPLVLILFMVMFAVAITLGKWLEYAVRNRTFKGFWEEMRTGKGSDAK
jgi:membrane protein implicated in regulation of membrane protease activity